MKKPIEFIGAEYYAYPGDEPRSMKEALGHKGEEFLESLEKYYENALGYTDTRRNINIAIEIISGPDGIPLPYTKGEYAQDVGWPLGM